MRIVCALGRKALVGRHAFAQPDGLAIAVGSFVESLAGLRAKGHEIVVTHAVGPQDGWLASQAMATPDHPYAHDLLKGWEVGMIGHIIADGLKRALSPQIQVGTLLTQVRVDLEDIAFRRPNLPIGESFGEPEARALAAERAWHVGPDDGIWRRKVASPRPIDVMEAEAIDTLLLQGMVVVCAGAGVAFATLPDGIPVGVAALVDNDAASAVLACRLRADRLLLLTNVDGVHAGWVGSGGPPLGRVTSNEVAQLALGASSMLPKVRAACLFADMTGNPAFIGRALDITEIVEGRRGTQVEPRRPA